MEIAGHFEKDDAAWEDILSQDKDIHIYAWQTGHQRSTNISTYGLNKAYPSRLQPELLKQYLRISEVWHKWIGVYESNSTGSDKKRRHVKEDKRTQEKEWQRTVELNLDLSPESKKLLEMQNELERILEYKKEERALRERYNI